MSAHEADTPPETLRKLADELTDRRRAMWASDFVSQDDQALLKRVEAALRALRALADPLPADGGAALETPDAIAIAQQGFTEWSSKPHNAKWVRRVDGTPIPNDLPVVIADQFGPIIAKFNDRIASEHARAEGLAKEVERLKDNYANGWSALGMIRQALEELGPVGVLPSEEAVLGLHGPEPVHEATVLVEGIKKIAVEFAWTEELTREVDRLKAKLASYEAPVADLETTAADREEWRGWHKPPYSDRNETRLVRDFDRLSATIAQRDAEITKLREALEPFALMASEGVVKARTGYVKVTTCAEYFHEARAALSPNAEEGTADHG